MTIFTFLLIISFLFKDLIQDLADSENGFISLSSIIFYSYITFACMMSLADATFDFISYLLNLI